MDNTDLIRENIPYISYEGELYFSVRETRKKHPELKFDTDKIITEKGINYIRAAHMELMTDFDRNILKAINFKTKK